MSRFVFVFMFSLVGSGAIACDVAQPRWLGEQFATIESALIGASDSFAETSAATDTEFGGAIVIVDNGYRLTYGAGCPGRDKISFTVPNHAIALWHTHGKPGIYTDMFSGRDAAAVQISGLPLFLVGPDRLQVLEPGRAVRRRMRARGSIVWVTGYPGRSYPVATLR